jgi:hypothetical protein
MSATLMMREGGTQALHVADPLGLTIAAMRRTYARLCGDPIPESNDATALDLLDSATGVSKADEPLLVIASDVLHGHAALDGLHEHAPDQQEGL